RREPSGRAGGAPPGAHHSDPPRGHGPVRPAPAVPLFAAGPMPLPLSVAPAAVPAPPRARPVVASVPVAQLGGAAFDAAAALLQLGEVDGDGLVPGVAELPRHPGGLGVDDD